MLFNALAQPEISLRLHRRPYVWERRRQQDFWSVVVGQHFTVCQRLGLLISPLPWPGRRPIPTKKRIAIALYKLATCAEYRVVGDEVFGVSKTSVHRSLYAVCRAIQAERMKEFIRPPATHFHAELLI